MKKNKKIIVIVALILVAVVAAVIGICRYNNIKEYKAWLEAADEEYDKENYAGGLGGYIRNIEIKDGIGYFIGIYGLMYHKEDYISMSEMKYFNYEYTAYETADYDVYYYSLYPVDSFPVGICIEDEGGNIIYSGVADVNNREALGQVHFEKGKTYFSRIYYMLDDSVVNAFVEYTKTGVSIEGYPTYENQRWDFMEMFGIMKK